MRPYGRPLTKVNEAGMNIDLNCSNRQPAESAAMLKGVGLTDEQEET
jgi:hypothetical protein